MSKTPQLKTALIPFVLLALIATVAIAAPPNNNTNNVDKGTATWSETIAPLVYENCVTCHRPGQVAPMSLLSYKERSEERR